jgi:deoxycytidylate deaminase
MNAERAAHTATLLNDGRVLIAGGLSGRSLPGAEIYDPKFQRFTNVSSMRSARAGHAATLLADGKVLISGGYNGGYLRSCEIFDPVTARFTPAGQMVLPRSGHAAVLLRNGKVLFAGGVGTGWTFLSAAELYDPVAGSSRPTGSMSTARESHTATRLSDGRVLMTGGHTGRRPEIAIHASAEIYTAETGAFTRAGRMAIPRHKHDAVLLQDGRVLVTGGSDERDGAGMYQTAEIFNPKTASFERTSDSQMRRFKHQGTSLLLRDGKVVMLGGAEHAELYDPDTGHFVSVSGDFGEPRFFAAATLLPRGDALVTGGYTENQQVTAIAWLYRP